MCVYTNGSTGKHFLGDWYHCSRLYFRLVMHRYHFFTTDPIPIHLRSEMADTDTFEARNGRYRYI